MSVLSDHSSALPDPASRILIAADVRDLGVVVDILGTLPDRTKGQVFVEVQSAEDIEIVRTPELITLAWLVRDARSGEPGTCEPCRPGVALARATRAWLSEMTTGDLDADAGAVSAWIIGATPAALRLRHEVADRIGSAAPLAR